MQRRIGEVLGDGGLVGEGGGGAGPGELDPGQGVVVPGEVAGEEQEMLGWRGRVVHRE